MCLPRDIHNISLGKEKSTPRINNVSIKIVSLKNYFIFFPFFESLQKSFFQFISSKFLPNLEIAHLLKIDRTGFNSTRRKDIDFPRERKKKERKRRKVKATKNRLSLGLTFSSFVRACRCGSMERETPAYTTPDRIVGRRVFTTRGEFFSMFQRVQFPRVERGPDAAGALPTGCAQRTRDTAPCAAN